MKRTLSTEQIKRLQELAALPDDQIDTSDIPEADEQAWENAIPGQFYRPMKKQVTIRIDADILAWLQAGGKGYQTRLNQTLRQAMLKELASK